MKIIMLIGPGKCGKTATIRRVYDELFQYSEVIEPASDILKSPKGDFQAVLKHRNGQKIGFYSQGNHPEKLAEEICGFSGNDRCDILVCACNEGTSDPFTETRKSAREKFLWVYKPVEKAPENERDAENEEYKSIIITLIVSLVNDRNLIAVL
jgi:GTPase SAR1 family protein